MGGKNLGRVLSFRSLRPRFDLAKARMSKLTIPFTLKPRTVRAIDPRTLEVVTMAGKTVIKKSAKDIRDLCITGTSMEECDLSALTGLVLCNLRLSKLTSFVLEDIPYLKKLDVSGNPLFHLKLDLPSLEHLEAGGCALETFDCEGIESVKVMSISNNPFIDLDLTSLTELDSLDCRLKPGVTPRLSHRPSVLEITPLTGPPGNLFWRP
jgi:hypothetical protein